MNQNIEGAEASKQKQGRARQCSHKPRTATSGRAPRRSWHEKMAELREYKEKHGNCLVSQRNKDSIQLARWVKKIRENYTKYEQGRKSFLNPERIEELNRLGFTWRVRQQTGPEGFDVRVSQLVDFRDQHGHTCVPHVYPPNPGLGVWVHNMRTFRRYLQEGKKQHGLNRERIKLLDDVGFVWKRGKSRGAPSAEERLEELKRFKSDHGHVNVRKDYKDGSLYRWLAGQRGYTCGARRTPEAETIERLSVLAELGVEWAMKFMENKAPLDDESPADESNHKGANAFS